MGSRLSVKKVKVPRMEDFSLCLTGMLQLSGY